MGTACTNGKSQQAKRFSRYNQNQIFLLELMFQDIASRSSQPGIVREHFDSFFHLNGLWGDEMFRTFDLNKTGYITFEQFLMSIDIMVKGTFDQKAKILFNFYDVDKTNGISYSELIKMLFSYPKAELNRMVTQQNFLASIDDYQKNFYFYPEKLTLRDNNMMQQQSQTSSEQESMKRIQSFHNPTARQQFKDSKNFNDTEQRKKDIIKLKNGETLVLGKKTSSNTDRHEQRPFQSIFTHTNIDLKRKKYVVCSNISSLVKKYAAFLFKEFRLDIKKDQMTFEIFKQLIKNHQSIFDSYFEAFHSYIWQTDSQQKPDFRSHTCWIEGQCTFKDSKEYTGKYLYFVKNTIFVLYQAKSKRPDLIVNMEGLSVQSVQYAGSYGFSVKHKDGIYPDKMFLFPTQELQQQWLSYLSQFKNNTVYQLYAFLQKVGEGNFSSVYKGMKQQTGEEVAIKVIKKFQLSLNQKNVIKSQFGILKLCHHPNIVKFHEIFDTRSHMYIVCEYLGQGDLFEYVKKNTFLEQYEAAHIMKQLADILKYLGMLDLIHRDIKPQNIMILMSKEKNSNMVSKVKLIDFGFAVYKSNLKNLTPAQKYAGTPGYIAPQVFFGEDFNQSFDIFSLGVIMYFMLCGSLPFFSSFYEQIVQQTKQCNISLKNAHWNNVSEQAKDLIYKMITFKGERINIKQVIQHPWLQNIEELKKYDRVNKKRRYI